MQPPVIFFIGPPGHGKTTAREIAAKLLRLKGGSTSEVIYHFLAHRQDVSPESLKLLPKESFRPTLIAAGDFLVNARQDVGSDPKEHLMDGEMYRRPSSLIRTLYHSGVNVMDGVRRRNEFAEAVDHFEWNGVQTLTIWVQKKDGPKISDNTELNQDDADEILHNDGTIEELEQKLVEIFQKRYGEKPGDKPTPPPVLVELPQPAQPSANVLDI